MGIIRKFIRKMINEAVNEELEKRLRWENIKSSTTGIFNNLHIPKCAMTKKDQERLERYEKNEKMMKEWEEFRDSGLLFYINQILHAFGYAICVEINDDKKIEMAYPTKIPYRGFGEESIDAGYKKLSLYLKNNSNRMHMEAYGDKDEENK